MIKANGVIFMRLLISLLGRFIENKSSWSQEDGVCRCDAPTVSLLPLAAFHPPTDVQPCFALAGFGQTTGHFSIPHFLIESSKA